MWTNNNKTYVKYQVLFPSAINFYKLMGARTLWITISIKEGFLLPFCGRFYHSIVGEKQRKATNIIITRASDEEANTPVA